jgi:hypothetical protein
MCRFGSSALAEWHSCEPSKQILRARQNRAINAATRTFLRRSPYGQALHDSSLESHFQGGRNKYLSGSDGLAPPRYKITPSYTVELEIVIAAAHTVLAGLLASGRSWVASTIAVFVLAVRPGISVKLRLTSGNSSIVFQSTTRLRVVFSV